MYSVLQAVRDVSSVLNTFHCCLACVSSLEQKKKYKMSEIQRWCVPACRICNDIFHSMSDKVISKNGDFFFKTCWNHEQCYDIILSFQRVSASVISAFPRCKIASAKLLFFPLPCKVYFQVLCSAHVLSGFLPEARDRESFLLTCAGNIKVFNETIGVKVPSKRNENLFGIYTAV